MDTIKRCSILYYIGINISVNQNSLLLNKSGVRDMILQVRRRIEIPIRKWSGRILNSYTRRLGE